jgi:hypothetical protein
MEPPTMGLLDALTAASISNLIIFLPFALLLAFILRRSGKAERRVILEELHDEVGQTITAEEFKEIEADKTFRTRRIDSRSPAVSAALVNAQNELAFRKRRLRDRGFDPSGDVIVEQRRAQIAALRQRQYG